MAVGNVTPGTLDAPLYLHRDSGRMYPGAAPGDMHGLSVVAGNSGDLPIGSVIHGPVQMATASRDYLAGISARITTAVANYVDLGIQVSHDGGTFGSIGQVRGKVDGSLQDTVTIFAYRIIPAGTIVQVRTVMTGSWSGNLTVNGDGRYNRLEVVGLRYI